MFEKKINNAESMKNMALEYLNEKYDDTFSALGYSDGDWAYDYSTVSFISEKYGDTFEVLISQEDETYIIKDNYFMLTMKEDAEKYYEAFASKYGYTVEVKVRFISLGTSEIDANMPFSDYITNGKCNMEVYFISSSAFTDEHVKSIMTDICNAKNMGIFRFVVTNDRDLLSQYTISEIINEKADSVLEKKSYSIDSHYEIVE